MNIDAIGVLLEAARESGFGRFDCLTIREVYGNTKRYTVTMHGADESVSAIARPHGVGATPLDAVAGAVERVRKWSDDRRASAANDAIKHGNLVASLAACKAVGGGE